jgi:hypothetical protein
MDRAQRRAATAAYKEAPATAGVYAVRCGDGVWVGASPTLDKAENRMRFTLKMGGHANKALQAAFAAHGDDALGFEPLETAPEDQGPIGRKTWLAERVAHWRAELDAAEDKAG